MKGRKGKTTSWFVRRRRIDEEQRFEKREKEKERRSYKIGRIISR